MKKLSEYSSDFKTVMTIIYTHIYILQLGLNLEILEIANKVCVKF